MDFPGEGSRRDTEIFFYSLEWIAERIRIYPVPDMDMLADDIISIVAEARAELGLDKPASL